MSGPVLHIAWVHFQRRQLSMREFFNFEVVFLPARVSGRALKVLFYFVLGVRTLRLLAQRHPVEVWVQLPQVPLLIFVLLWATFATARPRVIADCHNSLFRSPWAKWPRLGQLLNRCDLVVVHNEAMVEVARLFGVRDDKVVSLEDPPAAFPVDACHEAAPRSRGVLGVFPSSLSPDEPIRALVAAVASCPGLTVVITGAKGPKWASSNAAVIPDGVSFSGYLEREEFDALLVRADFVIGLTELEDVQLSACGEAVGAAKPMLLSSTRLLKTLFSESAIFAEDNSADGIAKALRLLIERREVLSLAAARQREERWAKWRMQAQAVQVSTHG